MLMKFFFLLLVLQWHRILEILARRTKSTKSRKTAKQKPQSSSFQNHFAGSILTTTIDEISPSDFAINSEKTHIDLYF